MKELKLVARGFGKNTAFVNELLQERDILRARVKELEEALDWVLPMSKGYAAEHPVGRNQEIVNQAVAITKQALKEATDGY